jgi:hypothetical protein
MNVEGWVVDCPLTKHRRQSIAVVAWTIQAPKTVGETWCLLPVV